MYILIVSEPPAKKQKRQKVGKVERMIGKTLETFLQYQKEAEARSERREEERWKKEIEIEERRRKAEQEHELKMMELLMKHQPHTYHHPSTSVYNQLDFVNDTTY